MQKKGIVLMNLIKVENLEKCFKDKKVINKFSYEFENNHVYGIIGRNGSGKSVLIKLLLKAISPSSGNVIYGEINGTEPVISCIIDGCDLYMNITGLNNLIYLASFRKRIDKEEIKEYMRMVGLDPDNKVKVKKYSLGMKKRLLIAQAIMENPDILILDEPTNSLDNGAYLDYVIELWNKDCFEGDIVITGQENYNIPQVTAYFTDNKMQDGSKYTYANMNSYMADINSIENRGKIFINKKEKLSRFVICPSGSKNIIYAFPASTADEAEELDKELNILMWENNN